MKRIESYSIRELEDKLIELRIKKSGHAVYSCHDYTYGDYSFGYEHVVIKDSGGNIVAVIVDEDIVRKYLNDNCEN